MAPSLKAAMDREKATKMREMQRQREELKRRQQQPNAPPSKPPVVDYQPKSESLKLSATQSAEDMPKEKHGMLLQQVRVALSRWTAQGRERTRNLHLHVDQPIPAQQGKTIIQQMGEASVRTAYAKTPASCDTAVRAN